MFYKSKKARKEFVKATACGISGVGLVVGGIYFAVEVIKTEDKGFLGTAGLLIGLGIIGTGVVGCLFGAYFITKADKKEKILTDELRDKKLWRDLNNNERQP